MIGLALRGRQGRLDSAHGAFPVGHRVIECRRAKSGMTRHPDRNTSSTAQDSLELGKLGYAQELFRTMGGFSNFASSFSIISILRGAVTRYGQGRTMGG